MAFSARWRARHRGSRSERGAAAVEFAIVLTVLLLIIFAIIDFGRLLFAWQSVKAASREAARAAVVATGNDLAVFNAAGNSVRTAASLSGGGFTVVGTDTANGPVDLTSTSSPTLRSLCLTRGQPISVAVTITPFKWFTPVGIFASSANKVDASTTMRCE